MIRTLEYGTQTIEYDLAFAKRRTLGVTVHPDTRVEVVAPEGSDIERIEQRLKTRSQWILKQQRELAEFLPMTPPRRYVSGETHLYLGRQYRLKVLEGSPQSVKLTRGWFYVTTAEKGNTEKVKQQLNEWYRAKARIIFAELLTNCMKRARVVGITDEPEMRIRNMEKRWGSCSAEGVILLNLKLMQVSKPLIEYVIMHELCHLKEHNHSGDYWALLGRAMPDRKERKKALNLIKVA